MPRRSDLGEQKEMRIVNGARRGGSSVDSTDRVYTGVGPGEVTLKGDRGLSRGDCNRHWVLLYNKGFKLAVDDTDFHLE